MCIWTDGDTVGIWWDYIEISVLSAFETFFVVLVDIEGIGGGGKFIPIFCVWLKLGGGGGGGGGRLNVSAFDIEGGGGGGGGRLII
jgi:hypothetical protein